MKYGILKKTTLGFFTFVSALTFSKPPPPLLPPSEEAPRVSQKKTLSKSVSRSEKKALGFELGTLGIGDKSSSDLLGLQLLFGLRAQSVFPLSSRIFLKPSLGYFFKSESEGGVSVFQSAVELGLGAQYILFMKKGWLLHAGISQKMDYVFSKISIAGASGSTPGSLRYRAGPSTGARIKVGLSTDLTLDLEGGVVPFENLRPFAGFSSGLIFFFN